MSQITNCVTLPCLVLLWLIFYFSKCRWSHHCNVSTCDDDILRQAMGDDNTVSTAKSQAETETERIWWNCLLLFSFIPSQPTLSVSSSVYLSISLSLYFSIFLSLYLSISISVDLSIYLSVCPSIYLSVCLSICPSVRHLNLNTFLLLTFYICFRYHSSLV